MQANQEQPKKKSEEEASKKQKQIQKGLLSQKHFL